MNMSKSKEAINNLYTDFKMLADGEWIPDSDSVEASIEQLKTIIEVLIEKDILPKGFEPKDKRNY